MKPALKAKKNQADWNPALREAAIVFFAASIILMVSYAIAFRYVHPEFTPFLDRSAPPITVEGYNLIPLLVEKHKKINKKVMLGGLRGNEALLSLGRSFQAEDYPFLKVNLHGLSRHMKAKILWRLASNPEEVHAIELNRSGHNVTQVAMFTRAENYQGAISELLLLIYEGPELGFKQYKYNIVIENIELRPFSFWRMAEQIAADWTNPPLLNGLSANVVRGVHFSGILSPNAAFNLIAVIGFIVAFMRRQFVKRRYGSVPTTSFLLVALCLCFYCWASNDALRWIWRAEQLTDSHERYFGLHLEERIYNNQVRCARFPESCRAGLLPYF